MTTQVSVFEEMWREQKLCDALLSVDGAQFHAHKLVLCSCSSYFKALFTHWSSSSCQVFDIPNVSADIMKVILEFAYTGVICVTEDNFQELFLAADRYDVTGITQACCRVMEGKLSPQTCISTWWFTNSYYYPELRHKAFSYILTHFEEVVGKAEDFLLLSMEDLCNIIEKDQLNVSQESIVFQAVLSWIIYSPQERQVHMAKLLQKVRLALIDPAFFTQFVLGNEMVQRNRKCKLTVIRTIRLMLDVRTRGMNASLSTNSLARPRLPRFVLMAVGGWSHGNPTNSIEMYDSCSKRWVALAHDDETPRAYHGTVFLNNSLYVIGGFDGLEQFSTMHKYDLVSHTWQEVAPMHSRRCYVSVALLDGFIYAMGGYDGEERLETAERYAAETNQWTMIAPMHEQRSDASCTTFNGKIYICGGFNGDECLSTAECYNPSTGQWTFIAEMSCPRSGIGVIAYANEIYAVGGFTGLSRLSSVEAYNPETNTWRLVSSMLNGRSNFGIEVLDNHLFVVGGYNGFTTIHCVESFDAQTGVWSEVRDMAISRSALSCSVVLDLPNMADYTVPHVAPPPLEE